MRRRRGGEEVKKGAPEWIVTYGDMTSLLLCFFILLYSFSTIDSQRFQMVILSLRGAFGLLEGGRTLENADYIGGSEILPENSGLQELMETGLTREALEEALQEEQIAAKVIVVQEARGLVLRFVDSTLFESGRAELTPDARVILDKVAGILKELPNQVRVEGHTDNRPINTPLFPSNWELSTTRATTVIRYFIEKHRLPPERLAAAGYGEYYPVAPNDSDRNRALNRRVDVVILWSEAAKQESAAKPDAAQLTDTEGGEADV